jgi:diguanylate cyclase
MASASRSNERAAALASRELADVQAQMGEARSELSALRHEILEAQRYFGSKQAAQLLEANENLVLAMLQAQTEAETSSKTLERVSRSTELDALTELPNRTLMLDRLSQAITNAKRHGMQVGVLFLDLNNFKQINDTFGHAVGDEVLRLAARCLARSVRETDTVSRYGGDEFLILLSEVSQAADAAAIADKVSAALSEVRSVGEHPISLSASVGISLYPSDGDDAETLIKRADTAMYRAKAARLGSTAFHGRPARRRSSDATLLDTLALPITQHALALAEHAGLNASLREANEQLVLAALSAQELQAAAERAQRGQTEFLAMLAHELRNPLAPLRTAAALLERVGPSELPRLRAIIDRQVAHMTRMLGDLLDVSRVHTGKLRLERRTTDMAELIEATLAPYRASMLARSQRFDLSIAPGKLEVNGDPVRLSQVFSNLLDNACKYTPDGGAIGLTLAVEDRSLVTTVCDDGIGITAAALPHIFDVFVQEPHAVGFNGVGLGIGLTVVRELVESHGGTVTASSDGTGRGTCFIVTLPLLQR